jgi:hypothetical protein
MINPYYNPDKLGLTLLSFDEPGMSYEYNTLCFWSTGDGRVYSASDSGCSCPTPFEGYEGADQKAVLQGLEQIESPEQAEQTFKSWNRDYNGKPFLPQESLNEAVAWVKEQLTRSTYSI